MAQQNNFKKVVDNLDLDNKDVRDVVIFFRGKNNLKEIKNTDFIRDFLGLFNGVGGPPPKQRNIEKFIKEHSSERKKISFYRAVKVSEEYHNTKSGGNDKRGFLYFSKKEENQRLAYEGFYSAAPLYYISSEFSLFKKELLKTETTRSFTSLFLTKNTRVVNEEDYVMSTLTINAWCKQVDNWIKGNFNVDFNDEDNIVNIDGRGRGFSTAILADDNGDKLTWLYESSRFIEFTDKCAYLVVISPKSREKEIPSSIVVTRLNKERVTYVLMSIISADDSRTVLVDSNGFAVSSLKVSNNLSEFNTTEDDTTHYVNIYAEKGYLGLIAEDTSYGILKRQIFENKEIKFLSQLQYWAVFKENSITGEITIPNFKNLGEDVIKFVHYWKLYQLDGLPKGEKEESVVIETKKYTFENTVLQSKDFDVLNKESYSNYGDRSAAYGIPLISFFLDKDIPLLEDIRASLTQKQKVLKYLNVKSKNMLTPDVIFLIWYEYASGERTTAEFLEDFQGDEFFQKKILSTDVQKQIKSVVNFLSKTIPQDATSSNIVISTHIIFLTFLNTRFFKQGYVCPLVNIIDSYRGNTTPAIRTVRFIASDMLKFMRNARGGELQKSYNYQLFEVYRRVFFLLCFIYSHDLAPVFIYHSTVLPLSEIKTS